MGGRRKRAKGLSGDASTSGSGLVQQISSVESQIRGDEESYEARFPVDSTIFESGSFASRCSVRLINDVVSKFDETKRELVKSTGFEGILHFPVFKQFNRKFALWLMSCVNESSSCLEVGPDIRMKFTKSDVGHVLGIPSAGRRILDSRFPSRDAKEKVLKEFLPVEFREQRSIKIVQEIIERSYVYPMSKADSDIFRVAFIVFVVSNLLAPSAKYDYASIDYWNVIRDPDGIISFDWCDYVVTRLLEAVTKLKQDISSNIKFPNITGCSIFLQVFYLDSLKLEGLEMAQNSLPRIRDFSYEKMRSMIMADRNYVRHIKGDNDLPFGKLREPNECIYSWAVDFPDEAEESRSACVYAIWESVVAMVHLLNMPLEAAGPIFVAAADFQEQIYAGLKVTGVQAIKFISVMVSILIPYTRGFSYLSSTGGNSPSSGSEITDTNFSNGIRLLSLPIRGKRKKECNVSEPQSSSFNMLSWRGASVSGEKLDMRSSSSFCDSGLQDVEIGDDVQRSFKSVIASLDGVPHNLNLDNRVATAMSQFYSIIRRMKPARDIDLNAYSPDDSLSGQSCVTSDGIECDTLPSPWDLGCSWDVNAIGDGRCCIIEAFKGLNVDDSVAILHRRPKVIEVSWRGLREQVIGVCEVDMELFDAMIRVFRQLDDEMYVSYGCLRWRHFFESDFMASILAGSLDLVDSNLCHHLPMCSVPYDLFKSKLMFFPALLHHTWVCFVWNLEKNTIYVFEASLRQPVPEARVVLIERSCFLLKLALQNLCRTVFNGISVDPRDADLRILTLSHPSICRMNRSGVLCALFCRCYDGSNLRPSPKMVSADQIAGKIISQIYELKDNLGTLPQFQFGVS